MRRFHTGLLGTALAVLVVATTLVGCGKTEDDDIPPARRVGKGTGGGGTAAKAALKPYAGKSYDATLEGKVTWEGSTDFDEKSRELRVQMANKDRYCLAGQDYETTQQEYRIGANKGLGNVVIWLEAPPGHYFVVEPTRVEKMPKKVIISQPHCAFLPHVSVLAALHRDGKGKEYPLQALEVENDAKVAHNASIAGGPLNMFGDQILQPGLGKRLVTPSPDRTPLTISCGVHGWMRAYVRVFDHPFAAVSSVGRKGKEYENKNDPNFGTYRIEGVPVGVKVRLMAWHESNAVDGLTTQEITIKPGKNEVNFKVSRK